jgi:HK97 gp10 family phage protein
MIKILTQMNTGPLTKLTESFRKEASKVIRMAAFEIEGDAKMNCPVDTGALRASIYTTTYNMDGRQAAVAEADTVYWSNKEGADVSKGLPLSPPPPQPADELTAYVSVGMKYGIHVEYGTSRMAARPFMEPAAERARKGFYDGMAQAFKKAGMESGWK